MNKLFILLALAITIVSCKNEKKQEMVTEGDHPGIYEAIFIDVNNTRIPDDIDKNVLKETRLLTNLNLVGQDLSWGDKTNYYVNGMGSLDVKDSGTYYFRLSSAGKILLRVNFEELIKGEDFDKKVVNEGNMNLDAGPALFEFEYYPGAMEPYLVLEWSTDGEHFEVVPDAVFKDLEPLTVHPWEGDDESDTEVTQPDNTLSDDEINAGWKLLFDGKTTNGWHTYNKPGTIGRKWKAENGALVFEGRDRFEYFVAGRKVEIGSTDKVKDGGEDIVSDQSFDNFELNLEWKISKGGNNGLFYTVKEDLKYDEIWKTSPEMQVMDNEGHRDGLIYTHRAGDLYDLIAADPIRVKPYGQWNKVRIIKNGGKIEQWLNGAMVVSFDVNSEEWMDMISKSKFSELEDFASPGPGKIGFQDHDNLVYYKNIKIKEM